MRHGQEIIDRFMQTQGLVINVVIIATTYPKFSGTILIICSLNYTCACQTMCPKVWFIHLCINYAWTQMRKQWIILEGWLGMGKTRVIFGVCHETRSKGMKADKTDCQGHSRGKSTDIYGWTIKELKNAMCICIWNWEELWIERYVTIRL